MLVEEAKSMLKEKLLPYWINLKDEEYGGYYGFMDFNLNLDKKAVKGCILNSRILWFFSNAYKTVKEEGLLEYASHAYEFFKKYCIDPINGGVYWSVNFDGTVADTTKYTYCQAFAIYALSSYYEITKNEQVLSKAYDVFNVIETMCTDHYGYLEAFSEDFKPIDNEQLSENGVIASKTMNTLLHVLEAYTELYRVTDNKRVALRIYNILDIIANRVYNTKLHRQEVFFDDKMNSILDLHSYGHDIETAWLLDRSCDLLRDEHFTSPIRIISRELEEQVYKVAYQDHSLYNECEKGVVDKTHIWWVQAEAVVGFLNAYERTHKECYKLAVSDIYTYISEKFVDKRKGSEWFSQLDENHKPDETKAILEPWKCPYHNGRMCFEIINRNLEF